MSDLSLRKSIADDLKQMSELFSKKALQYSPDADELANFRQGAFLQYGKDTYSKMFEVAKSYMLKHISMLYSGEAIDKKNMDESLMDIAVYSLIMRYMIKQHKSKNKEGFGDTTPVTIIKTNPVSSDCVNVPCQSFIKSLCEKI